MIRDFRQISAGRRDTTEIFTALRAASSSESKYTGVARAKVFLNGRQAIDNDGCVSNDTFNQCIISRTII